MNTPCSVASAVTALSPASNDLETDRPSVADMGIIRVGGGFRLPAPAANADKIRLGGGFRLPAAKPVVSADRIRLGGGFRLPAARSRG